MNLVEEWDARSPRPRAQPTPLTSEFASAWTEVEPPLRRFLASRGLASADIDDVIQETALRALASRVPFSNGEDLRRWCFVVAKRLHVDRTRQQARLSDLDGQLLGLEDPSSAASLAQVEDRHLLRTVMTRLVALPNRDQEAVLGAPLASDLRERNRASVARHRARQRLLRAVGPLGAFAGCLGRLRTQLRCAARPVLLAGAPVVAALTMMLLPSLAPTRHGEPPVPRADALAGGAAPLARSHARTRLSSATPAARATAGVQPHRKSQHRAGRTVAMARGPHGAVAFVRLEENSPERPLVCVDPKVASPLCVPKPRPGTFRL